MGVKFSNPAPNSGLAQRVVRSAVNREDLSSNLRAGARFGAKMLLEAYPTFNR
jgi:hypothetical protein